MHCQCSRTNKLSWHYFLQMGACVHGPFLEIKSHKTKSHLEELVQAGISHVRYKLMFLVNAKKETLKVWNVQILNKRQAKQIYYFKWRIPVGYWYWDVEEGEPFPTPNLDDTDPTSPLFYLKRGLQWMDELGLQALIDLHAGPGSQNGYDNSGRY